MVCWGLRWKKWIALWACSTLLGCTGLKTVPDGKYLYKGASFELTAPAGKKAQNSAKEEAMAVVKPAPNQSVGPFRPKLSLYHYGNKTTKEKGLRHWIKTKLGEPPVLLEQADPAQTARLMENRLFNQGFFDAKVAYTLQKHHRTASVQYQATASAPYGISSVTFPRGNTVLDSLIRSVQDGSVLRPGRQYQLDELKAERERIDKRLKNLGYFYFNPDMLIFRIDSMQGNHLLKIFMDVKEGLPEEATRQFYIQEVDLFPGYVSPLDQVPATAQADTLMLEGVRLIETGTYVRPNVLLNSLYVRPGQLYRREDYETSLSRLTRLGLYQFTNIRYTQTGDSTLQATVLLSPSRKKYMRIEANLISRSNNFAGPGGAITFTNRNAFKGAEKLSLNLSYGYETLISGPDRGLNSYEWKAETELLVPRFILPFTSPRQLRAFIPQTRFTMSMEMLKRVGFFRIQSFNTTAGYRWKESASRSHDLSLVNISFFQLSDTTAAYSAILGQNAFLRRSLENQFIVGTFYTYTYNNQVNTASKNHFYFSGSLDLAGNLLRWVQPNRDAQQARVFGGDQLFNNPYAQFVRFGIDVRNYFTVRKKDQLAMRFIAGSGIPTGRSETIPFVKQYFAGGANSLRAFQARSVGPGSFQSPVQENNPLFLDQSGDMKLEWNLEYRLNITRYVKFALFTDVGNVWLFNQDPDRPRGEFDPNRFLKELAVGTGMGVRIDATFFILRFDLAFPARIPSLPESERWVLNKIDFLDSTWRRQNLLLNIAIGYPF
jgi:outer membrane protein assembly factor BamA